MNQDLEKNIKVEYFASFAATAGKSEEMLTTSAQTMQELWLELTTLYQFDMSKDDLRAAKNHRFCDWQCNLDNNDIVAFIPPISGG